MQKIVINEVLDALGYYWYYQGEDLIQFVAETKPLGENEIRGILIFRNIKFDEITIIRSKIERATVEKLLSVDVALAVNRLVHNECKDVRHDIGLRIIDLIKDQLIPKEQA